MSHEYLETSLQESISTLVDSSQTPCYVVAFTHNDVTRIASGLLSITTIDRKRRLELRDRLASHPFNTPFGKELKRLLLSGIGVHYGGMLPRYRTLVEQLAQEGKLAVICGTDTLGVGINVPLRSVLFTQLCKYNGEKTSIISIREFEIAGRAGRKGFDERGFVYAQAPMSLKMSA